ncbi:MAG: hypothetical protein JHC87_06605, partial [Thermoleophilaceae bacterium]|nr:hypothetical protein [Thermoleophilaceae bacterium]
MPVTVVYLVWGPLGIGPLERFLSSYQRHPAGVEHELVIAFNGVEAGAQAQEFKRVLDGVECRIEPLESPVLDLAAYRIVADRVPAGAICLLNSYSQILSDDWLAKLKSNLDDSKVGMVGASASYESISSASPLRWRALRRRHYPAFPNPHLRVTGMMIDVELLRQLHWPLVARKHA